jgi:Ser/Thr protein kinase RdoA (MazF antagonist)
VARRAVAHWARPCSAAVAAAGLEPLGVSGSAVWRWPAGGGTWRVLRLVDPAHRTRAQTESELAFMRHLAARGVAVAEPLPSTAGGWTVPVDGFVASAVTWADGAFVTDGPGLDRAWGAALAGLHEAAASYDGPARWEWHDEPWLAEADRLLPADDAAARAEWARLRAVLDGLPRTGEGYGTIHGDHGPQNFRWDASTGALTTFDFANACRHWYAMDVTIALSTLRRDPARDRRRADLLAGYRSVRPLEAASWAAWPALLQLRILYVYLSRLDAFGPVPDAAQRATLAALRAQVASRVTWPLSPSEEPA